MKQRDSNGRFVRTHKTEAEWKAELADLQIKYERALIILDWCKEQFGWLKKRRLRTFLAAIEYMTNDEVRNAQQGTTD